MDEVQRDMPVIKKEKGDYDGEREREREVLELIDSTLK